MCVLCERQNLRKRSVCACKRLRACVCSCVLTTSVASDTYLKHAGAAGVGVCADVVRNEERARAPPEVEVVARTHKFALLEIAPGATTTTTHDARRQERIEHTHTHPTPYLTRTRRPSTEHAANRFMTSTHFQTQINVYCLIMLCRCVPLCVMQVYYILNAHHASINLHTRLNSATH